MITLLRCALALLIFQSAHAATYTLHTVQSGDVWSVIRFTNLTDEDDVIYITGFDNERERFGPVALEIDARATVVLSSRELERGAPQKGLYDGLGDGSGGWQLELETDLEIGAMSFKSGLASDVLAVAEILSANTGGLPPRFLWAHQLVDRGLVVRASPNTPAQIGSLSHRGGQHELLSAYDWIPHQEVGGVELGWGDYEYPGTVEVWTRYSGHLDYSAFAVQHGIVDGQHHAHAYVIGKSSECNDPSSLPSVGTKWTGAVVGVTSDGRIRHGPMSMEIDEIVTVQIDEWNNEKQIVLSSDMAIYDIEDSESVFAEGQGRVVLNVNQFSVVDPWIPYGYRLFGPGCAELTGWSGSDGGAYWDYWAFGARLVTDDSTEE